ncbi:DUF1653 domain-containing protein [Candidatus Woesearchaeota archaeon]|nr:DUF1653 domain-containing protein [Candidatus Woesearchaeota archaeon]
MSKLPLGRYQHYQGNFYEVLGIAKHHKTKQELVVYRGLYNHPEYGNYALWVRPVEEFTEAVIVDGKKMQRFKFVE